jgi:glycine/D-amino acid oxidase-like deaminating enzyme
MDLRTDYPYWLLEKGLLSSYPSLEKHIHTDVAIIGAGISGALIAWQLCRAGIRCVIVDKRHVGMGSTAATTGLLQYEIDTPLTELAGKVGEKNASESYLLCHKAIDELEKLCKKFKHAEFSRHPSLQYASFKKDVPGLKKEYTLRKAIGLQLDWMDREDVKSLYGFDKQAGLISKQGAAVNAYGLTHSLLAECRKMGLEVYDHTDIEKLTHQKKGIQLTTTDKCRIHARKAVIACGYESGAYLPERIDLLSTTYALISEPYPEKEHWHKNSLIWETARPYLYLRTTTNNRIIIGGKDDEFSGAYNREKALPKKVKELERSFAALFPKIKFKTDFYWAGLFAGTKDGLPYIGSLPRHKDLCFALGFGGNGIVFSQIAATLLKDELTGKKNRHADIFRFGR